MDRKEIEQRAETLMRALDKRDEAARKAALAGLPKAHREAVTRAAETINTDRRNEAIAGALSAGGINVGVFDQRDDELRALRGAPPPTSAPTAPETSTTADNQARLED